MMCVDLGFTVVNFEKYRQYTVVFYKVADDVAYTLSTLVRDKFSIYEI
jgi:hypothetical protein